MLTALALAVAALALYADRVLFDSTRFADHVELALAEPPVARDVGATLTDQVVRARPDLIAVEPLLRGVAEQVVRSERTPLRTTCSATPRSSGSTAIRSVWLDDLIRQRVADVARDGWLGEGQLDAVGEAVRVEQHALDA